MKESRLNRLFNRESGHCFDVAIDHGFFNQFGFLQGIEDIQSSVETVIEAGPDAIQLTIGQARHLQSVAGKQKPSLVLRTDVANVYGSELPEVLFSRMIEQPVVQAIRLDATCVVVNLFRIPGAPEVTDQCIQNILKLKPLCDHYAMPLMIEPLVFQPNEQKGGYMVDGNIELIMPLVRQGVELGADIIKADPTDDVDEYHRVVEVAGSIPILVRGGGRASDQEVLQRTHRLMQQGIKGIVYGRNVIQHAHPKAMTEALMGIVHEKATPDDVMGLLEN
ncbi:Fructose-bisphosphate aldolase class Ia, DhnA family [Fodinibius roseus]|uniref:Fructose-bisphosphate aldolase class Ia, DhnA family n=1 Tax=Fodinibius roseus TaxID=1194090 RepID=A0A1M5LBK1_9BACT|nr:aldolase [Fodinibius roseus]SHG62411.1 Fructose-bisphosphate aldolase class Ia, DhnA family [Fodinibius roseus]